ncbi:hypothetical protein KEM52_001011 [Ascosphaera acerosa]|nr:hypothetical protein KEM52_001011 [Ascosphaera acerosa]
MPLPIQLGKKKVKAIAKALRALELAPQPSSRLPPQPPHTAASARSGVSSGTTTRQQHQQQPQPRHQARYESTDDSLARLPIGVPERTPLCSPATAHRQGSYGSIIASPPDEHDEYLEDFELPDPALDDDPSATATAASGSNESASGVSPTDTHEKRSDRQSSSEQSAQTQHDCAGAARPASATAVDPPRRTLSSRGIPGADNGRFKSLQRLHRTISSPGRAHYFEGGEARSEAYKEFEAREVEFVSFLNAELRKIDEFYKEKENEYTERLRTLREQLHLLRDMRVAELRRKRRLAEAHAEHHAHNHTAAVDPVPSDVTDQAKGSMWRKTKLPRHMRDLSSFAATTPTHPRPVSRDEPIEGEQDRLQQRQRRRDFARKPEQDIPYRTAKRRLKVALIEYYRSLELLKSYVELNHTAFRKINKKYDKATHARPPLRFLNDHVNRAWFVQSEVLEGCLNTAEDLYSRYFEKGNRKVAVNKLRGKLHRAQDYSATTFRNGVMFASGFVLGVQGVVSAGHHLFHPDPTVRVQTSYILQLYAGYALILLHFLLFCLDCFVWTRTKINYVFVFEYDTRNVLDWRQLAELPCFFTLLLGLIMFLNFRWVDLSVYIYWPVILIGLTVIILFMPAPILYPRARRWWAYSNWRLLPAGLYPVEFRDFFLGDMYCSQTYAMGNVALFFCLYGHKFANAAQCNSNHSRAMGFMSTVPAIIRGLQCLRRYVDTRNTFPHLVNMGKYTSTLVFYVTLSVYRIDRSYDVRALFIFFAVVNALYSSTWDLAMDWSLGDISSKNWGLRDSLALRRRWLYYAAMVLDPILRFNWIFYVIFPRDFQHSALLSFFVALSEVLRRGMWVIFRVENEHCTNVELFRASRDVPLPYQIPASKPASTRQTESFAEGRVERATARPIPHGQGERRASKAQSPFAFFQPEEPEQSPRPTLSARRGTAPSPRTQGPSDLERDAAQSLRHEFSREHRSSISRMGSMLARAHTQDFERRVPAGSTPVVADGSVSSSEEEEEEVEEDSARKEEVVFSDDGSVGYERPGRST